MSVLEEILDSIKHDDPVTAVVGPLIEVPVLISLVYVALWVRKFFFASDGSALARVGRTAEA